MAGRDQDLLTRAAALIGKANRGAVGPDPESRSPEAVRQIADLTDAVESRQAQVDWNETLELIERTGTAISARDERTRELEAEVRDLADRTTQEIQRLQAEIATLEDRLQASEARRTHAEEWLRRVHDAIIDRFSGATAATEEAGQEEASRAQAF